MSNDSMAVAGVAVQKSRILTWRLLRENRGTFERSAATDIGLQRTFDGYSVHFHTEEE
jgi:hypothetical protein